MDSLAGLDLSTAKNASVAMDQVRNAMSSLSQERTVAANGSAAMQRRSSLAIKKEAIIQTIGQRQSQDTFLQTVQAMGISQMELLTASKVHKTHDDMQKSMIDRLA
jgi:hypothetical protein